jgi:hypothetical protein
MNRNEYTFDSEIDTYKERIVIIEGIRRGLDKAKKYKTFSKRVVDMVKEELPDYTVCQVNDQFSEGIKVWGKGVDYNSYVSATIFTTSGKHLGDEWHAKLTAELDRYDYETTILNLEKEREIVGKLEAIQHAINQLKESAIALLPGDYPSHVLRQKFPDLF